MASVNAGQTVTSGSRSVLRAATLAAWCKSLWSRSATNGPASTSTPRTGLLADDRGELLARRSHSTARASSDHADDVEPGVIRASPAGVAAVGGRVMLQRVADDIRSRLAAATGQGVHGAFRSRAQPDGHRHGTISVIQISITAHSRGVNQLRDGRPGFDRST